MGGPPAAQGLPARGQARGSSAVPRGDDRGARLHLRQVLDQGLWLEEGSGEDGGGPGLMFRTEEMDINMGPQHPSTHGVLRLVLNLEGEEIVDVRPVIGYLHRGVEKLSEHRTYAMIEPLTDRLDYVAAISENLGYCGAVEKLMGLQVPPRAQSIRVILAELQRIASPLLWLGTHALDLGAMTVFFYTFREREMILDLFEAFCGARLTYNSMRIGGLYEDVPAGWIDRVRHFITIFPSREKEYEDLLTVNRIFLGRTKGVGVLTPEDAVALGVSGPSLRVLRRQDAEDRKSTRLNSSH